MADARFDELIQRLKTVEFLNFAAARTGLDGATISKIIDHYSAEVMVGLRTLAGLDLVGKRGLEVGAGIGLLSIGLASAGVKITALEPGSNGFDANALLGSAVRTWLGADDLSVLDIEVGHLVRSLHGDFDVIFSINVLEHIPDLAEAICAMEGVLAPGGYMVHLCPNYAVPYEPHFGIPLLPWTPRTTAWLFPWVTRQPAWPSLNFVTFRQIRRLAGNAGLILSFRPGMMYEAFVRLDEDDEFRARHTGLVGRLHRLLKATGMLRLLRHVPPSLATPMAFEAHRAKQNFGAPATTAERN